MDEQGFAELRKTRNYLEQFCDANGIKKNGHDYCFTIGMTNYIVSPHVIVMRNTAKGKTTITPNIKRKWSFVAIRAKGSELPRIYTDLKNGIELNERGERI